MRPPRFAEVLLESLGAQDSFREPLLGDLTEGFALRVERDGVGAARRWYYRESVRATPHLLGNWRRSLHAPDIRHLAGVVLASFFFTMTLVFLAAELAAGAASALGFSPRVLSATLDAAPLLALWLLFGTTCTVMGGFIAAWLDRRAPLVSAVALGLTWSCSALAIGGLTRGNGAHAWYWVCAPVLMAVGPIVGGVLRLRAVARTGGPR
jgi:hypothetical protein